MNLRGRGEATLVSNALVRTLLWIVLFLFGLTGVLVPAAYLWTATKIPQLNNEYDLESLMRLAVETERMSIALGLPPKERGFVTWEKPDLARYPKDYVALYLSQMGCPNYFKSPREDGLKWSWRLMRSTWGDALSDGGPGACEFLFASRIARTLNIKGAMETAVAVNKLHGFLQKDQLVAYDLSSTYFDRGVMGVEHAIRITMNKELKDMSLPELAEAALVSPPYHLFDEVKTCVNAALIKRARDEVLAQLAADELVSQEQATAAQAAPVACLRDR